MICPICKTNSLEGDYFCCNCGFDLRNMVNSCPQCGFKYEVGDSFCNSCGYRLELILPASNPTTAQPEAIKLENISNGIPPTIAPEENVQVVKSPQEIQVDEVQVPQDMKRVPDIFIELPATQTQTPAMVSDTNQITGASLFPQFLSTAELLTPTRIAGLVIAVMMICGAFIFPWFDFFGNSANAVGTLGWPVFPVILFVLVYVGSVFLSNRILRSVIYGVVGAINLVVWITIRFILMEPLAYFIGSATDIMGFGFWLFLVSAILAIILGAVELVIVKKLIPLKQEYY